jgi:F-type H+-transporting ATPase subunit b
MLIDWLTTAAQIINFLILIFLLKKFLYGPIIRAMDAREEKIASRLEEAKKKQVEAEYEVELYREKSRALDENRAKFIDEARKEAEIVKKELAEQARQEVEELRDNWYRALKQGERVFLEDLRKQTTEHVYKIARKALSDLAMSKLEESMTDVFVDLIKNLDADQQKDIREAIRKAGGRVAVSSAFELTHGMRRDITREIHSGLMEGIDVDFRTEPGLVSGIELKTPIRVVAWNLDEYLKSLERELSKILSEETGKAGA